MLEALPAWIQDWDLPIVDQPRLESYPDAGAQLKENSSASRAAEAQQITFGQCCNPSGTHSVAATSPAGTRGTRCTAARTRVSPVALRGLGPFYGRAMTYWSCAVSVYCWKLLAFPFSSFQTWQVCASSSRPVPLYLPLYRASTTTVSPAS